MAIRQRKQVSKHLLGMSAKPDIVRNSLDIRPITDMRTLGWLTAAVLSGAMVSFLASCSEPDGQAADTQSAPAKPVAGSESDAAGSAVAQALSGKLVKIQNGAAAVAAIEGDPEYFVFYHSASW